MEWLPYAWPGLHINHMMPLAYDWADAPNDMQWLSVADKRAKYRLDGTTATDNQTR